MNLKIISDVDGILVPIEFKDLPFVPQRIFYVTNVPAGEIRGQHAHYQTEQILICLKGYIKVGIHDGDLWNTSFIGPNESIYIKKMEWDYQQFLTGNDILLSICSTNYDKSDYIEDFKEFLRITHK